MGKAHKFLLRLGNHQAPQGELRATPERMRHWERTFARQKALGIRIPATWGHSPRGLPHERQEDRARFNAGYIDSLAFDPASGEMSFSLDAPGCDVDEKGHLVHWERLPNGREVKCAVGEVSAGFRNWRDGQGREWPDSLVHVALTTLPVVAGQPGFRQLSAGGGAFYLGLTYLGADMAEDEKPDKDKAPAMDKGGEEMVVPPDDGKPDAPGDPPPPPAAPEVPPDPHFGAALAALQGLGLHLLPDTTPANFAERILVACHALDKGREGEPEEEGEEAEGDKPTEYKGPTQEEQRPVMMSLSTAGLTATERKMLALKQAEVKGGLLARIDRLQKAGRIPPPDADRLRAGLSGYTLSLDADLKPAEGPVEFELSVWERVTKGLGAARGKGLKGAKEEERPVPSEAARLKEQEEAGDELAGRTMAPARK